MRQRSRLLLPLLAALFLLAALAGFLGPGQDRGSTPSAPAQAGTASALPALLPPEAAPVIARIQRGGRFVHRQDGSTFGNRERRLPLKERGYYREYTVPTPGLSHRGARRIVTGGQPPREWYYTADHYESFRRFQPPAAGTMQ